jgi:hypothetical protein
MGEQNADNRPVVATISTRMDNVRRMIGLICVDDNRTGHPLNLNDFRMARSLKLFVDDFDFYAVGVFEIDGVVPGGITGRCHGSSVEWSDSVRLKEIHEKAIDHFRGLHVERYVAEPSSFAMKFRLLMTRFGDLNTEVHVTVRRIKMITVGKDGELKEPKKALPKVEGLVVIGHVDPDVTHSRFHDITVAPTPRCVWCCRW